MIFFFILTGTHNYDHLKKKKFTWKKKINGGDNIEPC